MSALPAVLAAVYAAAALPAARHVFARIRPWREPLRCTCGLHALNGGHEPYCYRRIGPDPCWPGSWWLDTRDGTALIAAGAGLAWPLLLAVLTVRRLLGAARWAVTAGTRELPAERAARTRRLEAENERLRRDQEGDAS